MSAIAGLLALGNLPGSGAGSDEWVSEYQETILVRNSKGLNAGTTLFGLMSRLKNEPAETNDFKWFERDPVQREVLANGSFTSGTTLIQLQDAASNSVFGSVQVGTILYESVTGETMLVTAYNAPNYTVTRAIAGSGTAITSGDKFVIVTLGQDEGANPVSAVYEPASSFTNYVQTFNSVVFLANAFKGSKLRTDIEGPLRDRRVQALERVARDIELAYFLGVKRNTAVGGDNGIRYYTGGIKAGVDAVAGTPGVLDGLSASGVPLSTVQTWLQSFMTVGSDAKLAFCGPKSYAVFSNFANDASNGFRITGQENVFGMNITMINTPYGELDLAMHPLFKEITTLQDWMFVVDLALLVQKVMEPLFLEPNIQTPGQDSYKEQFRAKYGLKLKFAQAFGYAKNLQRIN